MVIQGTRGSSLRDGDWKLVLCPGSGSAGPFFTEPEADAAWRSALKAFGRKPMSADELEQPPFLQLFNLAKDPGETTNLVDVHRDIAQDLEARLIHYARQMKPAEWIRAQPSFLGAQGETVFDPDFDIDDCDLPHEKAVLPQG